MEIFTKNRKTNKPKTEKNQIQCNNCKGIYFKVICEEYKNDLIEIYNITCIECGFSLKLRRPNLIEEIVINLQKFKKKKS